MGGYARFKTPARPHEYLNDRLRFQSIEEAFIVTRKKKRGRQREREREVSELIRNAKCRLKSRSRRDRRISLAVRQRKRC